STLLLDNQSAISMVKNPEHHGRMKQLDLCYYWLGNQAADLLTKPLTTPKVREFCQMLRLGGSGGSQ
ncbi:hypothetical protein SCLCIDRAFT_107988, partial [Scleroderma citrinum Foug A]